MKIIRLAPLFYRQWLFAWGVVSLSALLWPLGEEISLAQQANSSVIRLDGSLVPVYSLPNRIQATSSGVETDLRIVLFTIPFWNREVATQIQVDSADFSKDSCVKNLIAQVLKTVTDSNGQIEIYDGSFIRLIGEPHELHFSSPKAGVGARGEGEFVNFRLSTAPSGLLKGWMRLSRMEQVSEHGERAYICEVDLYEQSLERRRNFVLSGSDREVIFVLGSGYRAVPAR
jgi:hypothetical protein